MSCLKSPGFARVIVSESDALVQVTLHSVPPLLANIRYPSAECVDRGTKKNLNPQVSVGGICINMSSQFVALRR